ncbi:hypothetical protein PT274_02250 [Leuconostocaceae bacterium ESL0958]|nr:hypothetical protein [Leuconostocaceae bacterium ESL0958]
MDNKTFLANSFKISKNKTWLLASSAFLSAGLLLAERPTAAAADETAQTGQQQDQTHPTNGTAIPNASEEQAAAALVKPPVDTTSQAQTASSVTKDQDSSNDPVQETVAPAEPMVPVRKAISPDGIYSREGTAYEAITKSVGGYPANTDHPGDAQLDDGKQYVDRPGKMDFGEEKYSYLSGVTNDYANVSVMRLTTDESAIGKLLDSLKKIYGGQVKGSETNYYPDQNTLSYGGGFPFSANIISNNHSMLNPAYYYEAVKSTVASITNVLSLGLVQNKLNQNYDQGQYGIYLRMEMPEGVNPEEFVKTLNLKNTHFGSQMDLNVTLGLDRLIRQVPGLTTIISTALGLPISGYGGSIGDAILGRAIDAVNKEHGTHYSLAGLDSPFYPITLYPKDIKTNVAKDPRGLYLLVRGDNLKHHNGAFLQAKVLITKLFMNLLSWGGNIKGGAYGYLNFDLDRYTGNWSQSELKERFGADSKQYQELAPYADDSPHKVLTRGQLPPDPTGAVATTMYALDAETMVSKEEKDYGGQGDLGRDIAIKKDKLKANPLPFSSVPTWRAYISPRDTAGQLNSQKVTTNGPQWAEWAGMTDGLPGSDLDHRMVTLVDEKFMDNPYRFDHVVDYFDKHYWVYGSEQVSDQLVKQVTIKKSLDPQGQITDPAAFEIYDRPFTVYYTGTMTLQNGKVLPLRGTQLRVLQKRSANADPAQNALNQMKQAASQAIAAQALHTKVVIKCLQPKLDDALLASYFQEVTNLVASANSQLTMAGTVNQVADVEGQTIADIQEVESRAGQGHDLAAARLAAAKTLAKQALEAKARQVIDSIQEDQQLADAAQKTLIGQVATIKRQGEKAIEQAQYEGTVHQLLQKYLNQLAALHLDQAQSSLSQEILKQAGQDQKDAFAHLAGVDPQALADSQRAVDDAVATGLKNMAAAKDAVALQQALADGLQAIQNVPAPALLFDYQPADAVKKAAAQAAIAAAAKARNQTFEAIDHVDPQELLAQKGQVAQALANGQRAIEAAATNGALAAAKENALTAIAAVPAPNVADQYRPVTAADRALANEMLDQAAVWRQKAFDQLDQVDPASLAAQSKELKQVLAKAKQQLEKAKVKAELDAALKRGLGAIQAVALPKLAATAPGLSEADNLRALQELASQEVTSFAKAKQGQFQGIAHVDPSSLAAQSEQLTAIAKQAVARIQKTTDAAAIQPILQQALSDLQAVASPDLLAAYQAPTAHQRQQASDALTEQADARKADMAAVDQVDPQSLQRQRDQVEIALQKALRSVAQAATNQELADAVEQGLQDIAAVAVPSTLPAPADKSADRPSAADRAAAFDQIHQAQAAKKRQLAQLPNVDPASLAEQNRQLDDIVAAGVQAVAAANNQADLKQVLDQTLSDINDLANPKQLPGAAAVPAAKKAAAEDTIRALADNKGNDFRQIDHVEAQSLADQLAELAKRTEDALKAIQAANTNDELADALRKAIEAIQTVAAPALQPDYQVPTDAQRKLVTDLIKALQDAKEDSLRHDWAADPAALDQHLKAVADAVQAALDKVAVAETNRDLRQLFQDLQHQLQAIGQRQQDNADKAGTDVQPKDGAATDSNTDQSDDNGQPADGAATVPAADQAKADGQSKDGATTDPEADQAKADGSANAADSNPAESDEKGVSQAAEQAAATDNQSAGKQVATANQGEETVVNTALDSATAAGDQGAPVSTAAVAVNAPTHRILWPAQSQAAADLLQDQQATALPNTAKTNRQLQSAYLFAFASLSMVLAAWAQVKSKWTK